MASGKNAWAAAPEPSNDWSFYIGSASTSTAYNLGCGQGQWDSSHGNVNSLVSLDFGGQSAFSGYTVTIGGVSMSYAQDEAVVEPFGQGYYICTGSDTTSVVFIAMTTNNSLYQVNSSGGQAWANATIAASNYVYQYYGGNDIELSWSSASAAMAWVNGYQGVPNAPLYLDAGSAGGCPDSGYSFGNSTCNNGWSMSNVHYAGWGAAGRLLEIYFPTHAWEWTNVSGYGSSTSTGRIQFQPSANNNYLDPSTLTPAESWSDFWNDLNGNSATAVTPIYQTQWHDG